MSRDESQRTIVMMILLLISELSRRDSTADLKEPTWRHAGRECHYWKSFGEGCCSRSGRGFPGGVRQCSGKRYEHTPFPRYKQGTRGNGRGQFEDQRSLIHFSTSASTICTASASVFARCKRNDNGRWRTARRTSYTRGPSTIPTAVLSPFLSLTPPLQAVQEVDESLDAR